MNIRYEDYVDQVTDMLVKVLSARFVDQEESTSIVTAVTEELAGNIGDTSNIKNYVPLIYAELIKINDKKITEVLSDQAGSYSEIERGIQACEQQKKLLTVFEKEGWPAPAVKNRNPSNSSITLRERLEKRSILDKISEEDQQLTTLITIAQNELTVDSCDAALKLSDVLEADIADCKKKRISLPPLKNVDAKKTVKTLKVLRQSAEQKEAFYNIIFQTDSEINRIAGKPSSKDQWSKAISLCRKQQEQFKECISNNWPLPIVRYSAPAEVEKRYQTYQRMNQIDNDLTELRSLLTSRKKYGQFVQLCTEQQGNIETCNHNGWEIPVLLNRSPNKLADEATEERKRIDRKTKAKRVLVLTGIILIGIAALALFILSKYREGKVAIPFDDSYAIGMKVDQVEAELRKAGFVNVSRETDTSGWRNSNEVTKVSIDNSWSFNKGTYLEPDKPVVIFYSSENRVYVTELLADWKNMDYEEVRKILQDAGFTNIVDVDRATSKSKQENKTATIKLNGESFTNEYCYLPLNAPIVIEHYALKITLGFTNEQAVGQDYNVIVKMLKEKGFTDVQTEPSSSGWGKSNTVVEITVDGSKKFDNSMSFDPSVAIVVKYSNSDRVDITKIVKDWKTADYEELAKAIRAQGLNVTLQSQKTSSKNQNRYVAQITINNQQYKEGDCAPPKTATIKIKYYMLEITLGDFKYKGEDYKDLKKKLEGMGFSNISFVGTDEWIIAKKNEGNVDAISINGNEKPKKNDKYDYDAEVVITVKTRKGTKYEFIN